MVENVFGECECFDSLKHSDELVTINGHVIVQSLTPPRPAGVLTSSKRERV